MQVCPLGASWAALGEPCPCSEPQPPYLSSGHAAASLCRWPEDWEGVSAGWHTQAAGAGHPPPVRRIFLVAPDDGVVSWGLGGDGHDAGPAPVGLLQTHTQRCHVSVPPRVSVSYAPGG